VYNNTNRQTFLSSLSQVKAHNNTKSSVFWNIMLFRLMDVNPYFRGTHCLHLQGQRVSQVRNQHEAGSKQNWFLTWSTLKLWRWRWYVPLKRWLTFIGLHKVTSQKKVLFTATGMRTFNCNMAACTPNWCAL
jgi:hypothetical protein